MSKVDVAYDTETAAAGNTITFTSNIVGSDVSAIGISTPYGDEVTTASFQFDPSAVKEGSAFTFSGNSYQFVKTGEKAGTGKTAIEVADFDKATSKSLGDAFAAVAKNGTVKHASSLGIGDVDISTQAGAKNAIDKIKSAINSVSSVRSDLGAIQNSLEHTINNLSVTSENMTAAESRIRDVDMAQEMMNYTKNNILVQALRLCRLRLIRFLRVFCSYCSKLNDIIFRV